MHDGYVRYNRRLASRARLQRRLAAMAVVGVALATSSLVLLWEPDPIAAAIRSAAPPSGDAPHAVERQVAKVPSLF